AALPNLLSTAKAKPSLPMAASNEAWEGGAAGAPSEHAQTTQATIAAPIQHGSVVIAAITSCTNTSNPSVLIGAGLLAKNAVARGLKSQPHVKTSLAAGSKVVTEYLKASGLLDELQKLNFHFVGYGC